MAKKLKDLNLCQRVLREPGNQSKLVSYYSLSQNIEQEIGAGICKKGDRVWVEMLDSDSYYDAKLNGGAWVLEWNDTGSCAGGKMVGHIHTHPKGDKYFTEDDLRTANDFGVGCILYRKKADLRMRCVKRKGKKLPDTASWYTLADRFETLCDRSVSKKAVRRYRWPWKKF